MDQQRWDDVDTYIERTLIPADDVMADVLRRCAAAGLPAINVAPNQGKLLMLFAQMLGARSILEIGTLGGYSTIWLARGLSAGGTVTTIEASPAHASVASENFKHAGVESLVRLQVGAALNVLPTLDPTQPFDLFFIDADKANSAKYFTWAMRLAHPGSVIVCDNVVRGGRVIDARTADADIRGTRELFAQLAAENSIEATALQTVGTKGYDGLAIVRVIGSSR
jgi:predicted O-methyltransferase YrrM